MKKILLILSTILILGCKEVVHPKYKEGDMVMTKVDNRKGIIVSAMGSMYNNGIPSYFVRFSARTEDATTTEMYERVLLKEYEIELFGDKPTEGN